MCPILVNDGATRVVMLDIHSLQTIGYFDIPVDHIYGETVILDYLTSKDFSPKDLVVVSPDVGGVPRARAFAKKLCDAFSGIYTDNEMHICDECLDVIPYRFIALVNPRFDPSECDCQ